MGNCENDANSQEARRWPSSTSFVIGGVYDTRVPPGPSASTVRLSLGSISGGASSTLILNVPVTEWLSLSCASQFTVVVPCGKLPDWLVHATGSTPSCGSVAVAVKYTTAPSRESANFVMSSGTSITGLAPSGMLKYAHVAAFAAAGVSSSGDGDLSVARSHILT